MDPQDILEFRRDKDEFLRLHPQSPLPHELRHDFKGLDYYPPNPDMVFVANVEPGDNSPVRIATSDGQERTYYRGGVVHLTIDGEPVQLTLLTVPGHEGYFLPFRDATSGKETYGAGRYLDLPPAHKGQVMIDFNFAYNPYCAYSDAYSCALPPVENWLSVPIEAGEKTFGDH